MATPTAKYLAQLALAARRLRTERAQIEKLQSSLERVKQAGMVTSGESWTLDQVEGLLDEAQQVLIALEAAETTPEAADLVVKLEGLLARPEWELIEQVQLNLQAKEKTLENTLRDCEHQVAEWKERVEQWENLLAQAERVWAPVIREERQIHSIKEAVARAEQALRDQQLALVPGLLEELKGRDGGEPGEDDDTVTARRPRQPRPEELAGLIGRKVEQASSISRSAGLLLLQGPLVDRHYEYTVLMRTASEPRMQHGVNIPGESHVPERERNQMIDLTDRVTNAINTRLARQFEQRGGAPAPPADAAVPCAAGGDGQGAAGVADATVRDARPVGVAGQPVAAPQVEELAQSVGDLMYRLLLPVQMQDYLGRTHCSVTITTNDLELPWELMSYQGQFLCLTHPVARMPMGGEYPREGRPPHRPELRSRFLLIYSDPGGNLPAAEAEVDQIREALEQGWKDRVDVDVWKGEDAEGGAFTDALRFGRYDVIHYAGHASFDRDNPERSGLLLHGGEVFPARRVHRLIEGRPLFYLNACASGRVAWDNSAQSVQGYSQARARAEGLASAIIYGGALGCIGALWPIYDRPAREFAIEFYNRVLEGHMIGEAMRQARSVLRDRHPDQITWAAFVLYGDPTYRLLE